MKQLLVLCYKLFLGWYALRLCEWLGGLAWFYTTVNESGTCYPYRNLQILSGNKAIDLSKQTPSAFLGAILCCSMLLPACKSNTITSTASEPKSIIEKVTEKGPVQLTTRVTPAKPRLSDIVTLELLVTAQGGVVIEPPPFGQSVGDFLVLDYGERNKDLFEHSLAPNQRVFRYRLEPVQAGKHLIRSLSIGFQDPNNAQAATEPNPSRSIVESEPIEVEVTSDWGSDIPDLANLEPMLPPKDVSNSMVWLWSIPALAVLLIAIAAYLAIRRSHGLEKHEPVQTPGEIAQRQLEALLSEGLHLHDKFSEFYVRLTGIVRLYVEGTTGLRAPEQTTEEFLRDMHTSHVISAEHSVRLQQFLEAADMVKFAGQTPDTHQIESAIARAREFIQLQFATGITQVQGVV